MRIGSSERDDVCEFWFADNGVGVDVADRERIFAPFQRLAPAQHEGLGLGLATCREVVAAHGGRIWVDSVPSIGSTFRFTLLRPQGGATPPPALAADGAPSSAPLGGPGTVDRSTPANLTQR